jgi:two-component system chemotaxis response regulator CheY
MKILIVDDSNVVRRAIQRALGDDESNDIRMATNGVDAIKIFDEFQPEVVTMDITMPEMDGLTCLEVLMEKRPDTRVLVISALGDSTTAVDAVDRGAMGFLLKPFTPESLHKEIAELFNTED